jgi:hypothetical protein
MYAGPDVSNCVRIIMVQGGLTLLSAQVKMGKTTLATRLVEASLGKVPRKAVEETSRRRGSPENSHSVQRGRSWAEVCEELGISKGTAAQRAVHSLPKNLPGMALLNS